MNPELLADESFEVEGLGTLKPLTFKQKADLRYSISTDLASLATVGLSGNEKATAAAAIAVHVGGMRKIDQVNAILAAPSLTAEAAKMMLVNSKLSLVQVAEKITFKNEDDVHRAIANSYGFGIGTGGEESSDPPKTNSSATSESAESSPPSTDGPPQSSAT